MRTTHSRPRSLQAAIILLTLLFASIAPAGIAQDRRGAGARRSTRESVASPKLVLVIVVDQFRYDFLERFGDLFGKGGFRRLMNEGAMFTNANYSFVPTFTACGHAAIFSGSVPSQNIFVEGGLPTTHGSSYNYDTHVPVIFFGAGVRAGHYHAECSPSDIAPTLAALLGVEQPSNRVGRVLVEAIAEKGKAAAVR